MELLCEHRSDLQAQLRRELTDFASLELSATAESEQTLARRVAELESQLTEQRSALENTQSQLSSAQSALAQAEDKVRPSASPGLDSCLTAAITQFYEPCGIHASTELVYSCCVQCVIEGIRNYALHVCKVAELAGAHSSCAEAAEKAQKELRVLRGTCQQLTHDRMQSITNVRKAESEVGTRT